MVWGGKKAVQYFTSIQLKWRRKVFHKSLLHHMHVVTCHKKYDFISAFYEHIICLFHTWKQYIIYLIEAFCFKDCNMSFW